MKPDQSGENENLESASVEIRVIGGSAPAGWQAVDEVEEVVRLEKTPPKVRHSVDDMGPALPEPPRRRRRRKGQLTQRQWTMAMAGGVVALTVLAVVGLRKRDTAPPGAQVPFEDVGVQREDDSGGFRQVSENAQEYLAKAQQKVRRYLAAEKVDEIIPIIRDRSRWKSLLEQRWEPLRMDDEKVDDLQMVLGESEGHGWFSLNGADQEGQQVQLVFVPQAGDVQLDWAASFGVGDLPFSHLQDMAPGTEVAMRVLVGSDHYFTQAFAESDYLCFKLSPHVEDDWVWGYAKKGTPAATVLMEMLQTESNILEAKEVVKVILSLRKTESCGKRQFEITDLMSKQWIEWEGAD